MNGWLWKVALHSRIGWAIVPGGNRQASAVGQQDAIALWQNFCALVAGKTDLAVQQQHMMLATSSYLRQSQSYRLCLRLPLCCCRCINLKLEPKCPSFVKTDIAAGQCSGTGGQLLGIVRQCANQLMAARAKALADGLRSLQFQVIAQCGRPLVHVRLSGYKQRTGAAGLKHTVHQNLAVAQRQILWHFLAVGDIVHGQLVANRHVQQCAWMGCLIDLGKNATDQVLHPRTLPATLVSLYHFIERIAMTAGVEQQQAFDRPAGIAQHGDLVRDSPVALAHADRVDQHHVFVAQL